MLRRKVFQSSLFFLYFLLIAASFQFFNFSATSCKALYEDGPWTPICSTSVCSFVELDLPIGWLSRSVVFGTQAHAVTRIMRVLNFFVPNSGSPCCTESGIIFSDPNFHQEQLVELFVEDFLGDVIHQEFSESLQRMTPNTVPSIFLWRRLYNTDHRTFSFLSLPV